MKHLTQKLKREWLPLLIKRDGGFQCFYCKILLSLDSFVYDHLNCKRYDNRLENIVLACHSCNNKKPHDFDMQIRALDKLNENEEGNFMGEKLLQLESNKEPSSEIEINISNFEIVEQFLTETIEVDSHIPYPDALDSCVYLCKKKTGHGSQQSVRNYIATLTSMVAPFEIIRDENKKKIIVKRKGQ